MTKIERIYLGDALDVLKTIEDNSVDSVVTDPPYGLSKEPDINEVLTKWLAGEPYDHNHGGFMGKAWDSFVPHPDIWREVFRVLKPGGHALVFAGTRTQDLMTISLRLAGFEVRDVIEWLYFSGFPKSHDVGKAFDRRAGKLGVQSQGFSVSGDDGRKAELKQDLKYRSDYGYQYEYKSELGRKYSGWGTALKPAHEPIIVVRKPLVDAETGRKMTVADCVEKYGTGAINIDACRIGNGEDRASGGERKAYMAEGSSTFALPMDGTRPSGGRFPANCITLDSDEFYSKYFNITPQELSKKASKKDRNSDWQGEEIGLEPKERFDLEGGEGYRIDRFNTLPTANNHPTVKPTDLMAWLVRLVTPANGTVLDPFAGSGSTLVAAKREGFGFIGIEREPEYVEIIEARTHVKAIKCESEADE